MGLHFWQRGVTKLGPDVVTEELGRKFTDKYGEPIKNMGATVWKGTNGVNLNLGIAAVNVNTRNNIPKQILDDYPEDGYVLSIQYIFRRSIPL